MALLKNEVFSKITVLIDTNEEISESFFEWGHKVLCESKYIIWQNILIT